VRAEGQQVQIGALDYRDKGGMLQRHARNTCPLAGIFKRRRQFWGAEQRDCRFSITLPAGGNLQAATEDVKPVHFRPNGDIEP